MNRRSLLTGGIALAAVPTVASPSKGEAAISIDDFLSKATAAEKVRYFANELSEAMSQMHPDRIGWRVQIDHSEAFAFIGPSQKPTRLKTHRTR